MEKQIVEVHIFYHMTCLSMLRIDFSILLSTHLLPFKVFSNFVLDVILFGAIYKRLIEKTY